MRRSLGTAISFRLKNNNAMYELSILDFIQHHLRCAQMDFLMTTISLSGTGGVVWFALAVFLFIHRDTRTDSFRICLALGIGIGICSVIKPLVGRIRPCDINTAVQLLVARPRDYSFPSGHATAAFAVAACLLFSGNKWWPFLTGLAVLMAFSRLYLYVHFPTDVLAGSIFGVISGWAAYRFSNLPIVLKMMNRITR